MSVALHPGDLLVATPRPGLGRDAIKCRRLGYIGWTTQVPQNTLLLVVAPSGPIDFSVRVLHNDQLLDALRADVKVVQAIPQ